MSKKTVKKVGMFKVESGEVVISDPCYSLGTWCQGQVPAKNGKWIGSVVMSDEGDWGIRVGKLIAKHEDHQNVEFGNKPTDIDAGVDSGQMSIFDIAQYKPADEDDDSVDNGEYGRGEWYDKVCNKTLGENQCGVMKGGVASSSGLGDGSYLVFVEYEDKDDNAVAIKVEFL